MGIGQSPLTPARDTGPLKRRAVGLLAACSIVLALTGCGNAAAPTPQPTVTEPLPSAAEGVDVVSASGIVVPYREAVLNIRASGRLEEILVSEGEEVSVDQELARVESRDLNQALSEAEAGLQSAQANLAKARAARGHRRLRRPQRRSLSLRRRRRRLQTQSRSRKGT